MKTQINGNASRLTIVMCVLFLAGSALNAQTVEYEVTILPPIPDSFATVVLGMNNHGELVGYAQLPRNPFFLRGWKWSQAGGMVLLPAPPGINALRYAARDINDAGVIVGDGGGDSGEAWRLENGVYTLLGTIPGDPLSTGVSINESGDVVGFSGNPSIGHANHAYRYKYGESMVILLFGKSTAINDSGQVSAYSAGAVGGNWQAARVSPTGDVLWLGVLPGRNDSFGYGINQFGQVVGTSRRGDSSTAFVYTDGVGMQALPEVSRWNGAGEINSMGTIIGNGRDPKQGYVWTSSTGARLLTDLIDPALRITVDTAVDLNEFGQIAARGFDIGNRVFVQLLLTPVAQFVPGDMNCDDVLNGGDIDPFFLALGDPAAYAAQFPNCDPMNGDINGDGALNGGDIDPFFQCLGGNCP